MKGRRVLIVDDVRNTGTTFKRCADLVQEAGGTVIGTMQIIDRCEACVSLDVPNVALVEYKAPPNYPRRRARCARPPFQSRHFDVGSADETELKVQ